MKKTIIFLLLAAFFNCKADERETVKTQEITIIPPVRQDAGQPGGQLKYTGKYEANGMVIQVTVIKGVLSLIVPGAPIQELKRVENNKYKTGSFSSELFVFVEKNGKIDGLISRRPGQSLIFKKTSDIPDAINPNDALLPLRSATPHFSFLYSAIDSGSIRQIADKLEHNYKRITGDFKIKQLLLFTVRIYPSLGSFHEGINFPHAPDEVTATAFGKDDFRMTSPNAPGIDSSMLIKGVTHEFTHCVHLNVDYSPNNPRWLWEGMAMFESDWFFDPAEIDMIKNKNFPSLATLGNGMEYMLGYAIIDAIKDIWGFDTVIRLVKKRGDVKAVLQLDQKKFEATVFEHIYNKYVLKVKAK